MPAVNTEARSTTDTRTMITTKQIAGRRDVMCPPTLSGLA
jgi:hypothetical protein